MQGHLTPTPSGSARAARAFLLPPAHPVNSCGKATAVSLGDRGPHRAQSFSQRALPLSQCSLMQNSSPDDSQVLEDTEVGQAVWPR